MPANSSRFGVYKNKDCIELVYTAQYNKAQNDKWLLSTVSETAELLQPGQHRLITQQSCADTSTFSQIKSKISW